MNRFKLLKSLVLIALVAFLMRWSFTEGVKRTDADWSIKWALRDVSDLTVALQREVSERAEERRRQTAVDEERKRGELKQKELAAAAANAGRAADGLRSELDELSRHLARSESGRLSAVAAASAAKAEAAAVLSELLGELDELAGAFALEADEAYQSGESCERIYNRVIQGNIYE